MARPKRVTRIGRMRFYSPKTPVRQRPVRFSSPTRPVRRYSLKALVPELPVGKKIRHTNNDHEALKRLSQPELIRRRVALSLTSRSTPSVRLYPNPLGSKRSPRPSLGSVAKEQQPQEQLDQKNNGSPEPNKSPRTLDIFTPEQKEDYLALSALDAPPSRHSSLPSFITHAQRTGLSPTSSVYRGTFYEYSASAALLPFGLVLSRVGGRSDGGIDLWGRWYLDFEDRRSQRGPAQRRSPSEERNWCYVAAQCKNLTAKVGPSIVRELEGALAAFKARLGDKRDMAKPILGLLVTTRPSTPGVRAALAKSNIPLGFVCVPFSEDTTIVPPVTPTFITTTRTPPSPPQTEARVMQFTWNAAATEQIGLSRVGVVVKHPQFYKPPVGPTLRMSVAEAAHSVQARSPVIPPTRPGGELVLTLDGRPLRPHKHPPSLSVSLNALEVLNASTELVKASRSVMAHLSKLQSQISHMKNKVLNLLALEAFIIGEKNGGTKSHSDSSYPPRSLAGGHDGPFTSPNPNQEQPQAEAYTDVDRSLVVLLSSLHRKARDLNPLAQQLDSLIAQRSESKMLGLSQGGERDPRTDADSFSGAPTAPAPLSSSSSFLSHRNSSAEGTSPASPATEVGSASLSSEEWGISLETSESESSLPSRLQAISGARRTLRATDDDWEKLLHDIRGNSGNTNFRPSSTTLMPNTAQETNET